MRLLSRWTVQQAVHDWLQQQDGQEEVEAGSLAAVEPGRWSRTSAMSQAGTRSYLTRGLAQQPELHSQRYSMSGHHRWLQLRQVEKDHCPQPNGSDTLVVGASLELQTQQDAAVEVSSERTCRC